MEKVAVRDYKIAPADLKKKPFNQFRNYVFSQATIMSLYETLAAKGEAELVRTIHTIVIPRLAPPDNKKGSRCETAPFSFCGWGG